MSILALGLASPVSLDSGDLPEILALFTAQERLIVIAALAITAIVVVVWWRLRPTDHLTNLGSVAEELGHPETAVGHYREVLRLAPESEAVKNNLAMILATADSPTLRDTAEALRLAEEAVEAAPTNADYLDTLARAAFEGGDCKHAREAVERALELGRAQGADPAVMSAYEATAGLITNSC